MKIPLFLILLYGAVKLTSSTCPTATVQLNYWNFDGNEGDNVTLNFDLGCAISESVFTIDLSYIDRDTTAADDFTGPGTVDIPVGVSNFSTVISLIDDKVVEDDEIFFVEIINIGTTSPPATDVVVLGVTLTSIVTIEDDDSVTVSITPPSQGLFEGDVPPNPTATVTLEWSGVVDVPGFVVGLSYDLVTGGLEVDDLTTGALMYTLNVGSDNSIEIPIVIGADTIVEEDEFLTISLISSYLPTTFARNDGILIHASYSEAVITIWNDDTYDDSRETDDTHTMVALITGTLDDDFTPPVIDCPEDQDITSDISTPGVAVMYPEPSATDDSGIVILVNQSSIPGNTFPIGSTPVTYIFQDPSGNQDSCTFVITVVGVMCSMRSYIFPATGPLTAVVLPNSLFGGQENLFDASGSVISTEKLKIGTTRLIFGSDKTRCQQSIVVLDTAVPEVTSCPSDIHKDLDTGRNISVYWNVPTAVDTVDVTVTTGSTHNPGDVFVEGVTTVTYTFCDSSNNIAICSFTVNVLGDKQRENVEEDEPTTGKCHNSTQIVEVNERMKEYSVMLNVPPAAEPFLPGNASELFVLLLGLNEFLYNYTASDGVGATCLFRVLVTVINTTEVNGMFTSCPKDVTRNDTSIPLLLQWNEPSVNTSDVIIRSTHRPGDAFYLGKTIVTYTAEINGMVTDKCEFTINIEDMTPPTVFSCPVEVNASLCRGSRTVHWFEPYAIDNSMKSIKTSQSHFPNNSTFKLGTTRVIYFFQDESGFTSSCLFNVIVHQEESCTPLSRYLLMYIIGIEIIIVLLFMPICSICHHRMMTDK